jgi:hypothetical protein
MLLLARAGDRTGRVEPPAAIAGPGVFLTPAYARMPRSVAIVGFAPFGGARWPRSTPSAAGGGQRRRGARDRRGAHDRRSTSSTRSGEETRRRCSGTRASRATSTT